MAGSKDDHRSSITKDTPKPEYTETRSSPKTPQERQVALKAALDIDPGVTWFSWRAVQVRLHTFDIEQRIVSSHLQMYLVTLVACCCSGDNGFDGTVLFFAAYLQES